MVRKSYTPDRKKEEQIGVLPIVTFGGPWATVPELLFEKKRLIPDLHQLLAKKS